MKFLILLLLCGNALAQQKIIAYDPVLGKQPHKQQFVVEG